MSPPINIYATPHTNIFIGNNNVDARREGASLTARMLDRVQNMSAARVGAAVIGVYLASYVGTRLAHMFGDIEREQQLYDAYAQGAYDGFDQGYAEGFAHATRGCATAGVRAIAFAENCVRTAASNLYRGLLT